MKKVFLSSILLLSLSQILGAVNLRGNVVTKKINPLEKDFNIKLINDGLDLSPHAGEYVEGVRAAGICARDVIKDLHKLYIANVNAKVNLWPIRTALLRELLDDKGIVSSELAAKGVDVTDAAENQSKEKLTADIVELLKYKLIAPRKTFFSMLHSFAVILKDPVKKSLVGSGKIDMKNSILLKFFDVPSSKVETCFDEIVGKDAGVLKDLCCEFVIFCNNFWSVISEKLKYKRHLWLQAQAELEKFGVNREAN